MDNHRNLKYPEKAELYLEWLLTPPSEREPSTKKDMAEFLGVAFKTLYNWEKSEWFQAKMRDEKGTLSVRWWGDIMNRLKEVVDNGKPNEAISAARVLLGHLDFPDAERDTQSVDVEALEEALATIKEKMNDATD